MKRGGSNPPFIKKTIRFLYYNEYRIFLRSVPTAKGGIHMSLLILASLITVTIAATLHLINLKETQTDNQ